jgi:hypothetical protein
MLATRNEVGILRIDQFNAHVPSVPSRQRAAGRPPPQDIKSAAGPWSAQYLSPDSPIWFALPILGKIGIHGLDGRPRSGQPSRRAPSTATWSANRVAGSPVSCPVNAFTRAKR